MNRLISTALLLALAAPAWLLAGAAWNRSGQPLAVLALDGRELVPLHGGSAADPRALRLRWQDDDNGLLDAGQLQQLGFAAVPPRHAHPVRQRRAYALLELDPERWQQDVDQARARLAEVSGDRARPDTDTSPAGRDASLLPGPGLRVRGDGLVMARERLRQAQQASRLFLREVAADAASLHARCADVSRCLVLPVRVRVRWLPPAADSSPGRRPQGQLRGVAGSDLHLPSPWPAQLAEALRQQRQAQDRQRRHEGQETVGEADAVAPSGSWQAQLRQGRRHGLWLAQMDFAG